MSVDDFEKTMDDLLAETNQEQAEKRRNRELRRKRRRNKPRVFRLGGNPEKALARLANEIRAACPPKHPVNHAKDVRMVNLFIEKIRAAFPNISAMTLRTTALRFAYGELEWPDGMQNIDACEALGRLYQYFQNTYEVYFKEDRAPPPLERNDLDADE